MYLKTTKLICLIIILSCTTLFAYYKNTHREVAKVALAIIKRSDTNGVYKEVYTDSNSKKILEGSWQEDVGAVGGHDRAFRHYWDPDANVGCPWFSYFLAMPALEPGSKADFPEHPLKLGAREALNVKLGGFFRWHYPGALEWARNGAASGDLRNWEGAIESYSYTASSREQAYWRLGHVVHLVADMAEPDHTANVPHAASGFYYPKDLTKISTLIEHRYPSIGENKKIKSIMNSLKRRLQIQSWNDKEKVGFEGFVEINADKLFPSVPDVKVNKRKMFDTYFSVLASKSKSAVSDRHEFPLPLGVRYNPDKEQSEVLAKDDNKKNWSFFPSIKYHDKNESDKFLNLTRNLLTFAVGLDAGLLEFFHDIVDPPPYVRSVKIKQEGITRYHGWWKDIVANRTGRHVNENEVVEKKPSSEHPNPKYFNHEYKYDVVVRREWEKNNGHLIPGKVATVTIEFGPDPKGFDYPPEKIKKAWVNIGGKRQTGQLINDGTTWEGQFTPTLDEGEKEAELQMEIFAQDVHNHKDNRITFSTQDKIHRDKEYELDSQPDFPAKAMSVPPYDWKEYWPGTDIHHKIKVSSSSYVLFYTKWPSIRDDEFKKVLQPLLKSDYKPESWNSSGPYYVGTIEIILSSELEDKLKSRYVENPAMAYLLQTWITGKIDKSKKKPKKKKKKGDPTGNELYGVPSTQAEFSGVLGFAGQPYLFNDPMDAFGRISNCMIQGYPHSLENAKNWDEAVQRACEYLGKTISTSYGKLEIDTDASSATWILVGFKCPKVNK